jgi:hypothetical protein
VVPRTGVPSIGPLSRLCSRESRWGPETELVGCLSALKDAELIYERGIHPNTLYVFKHAFTVPPRAEAPLHQMGLTRPTLARRGGFQFARGRRSYDAITPSTA